MGIGSIVAGAIFRKINSDPDFKSDPNSDSDSDSKSDSKSDSDSNSKSDSKSNDEGSQAENIIRQLDSLFSQKPALDSLDNSTIRGAVKNSSDWRSRIEKICGHYQIEYDGLNLFFVNNSTNLNDTTIQNALSEYFLSDDNLYNPRKRFVLSYIIDSLKSSNIYTYTVFFKINEEANKKVFVNSLKRNGNEHTDAQKSILNLFFLAHLGNLTFSYNDDSANRAANPKTEYVSSMLSYGETVMVTFPWQFYSDKNYILSLVCPNFFCENGLWFSRWSTHSADYVDSVDYKDGVWQEKKLGMFQAAIISTQQKGININVSQSLNTQAEMGATGHILVGNLPNRSGLTGAFFKLEDSEPSKKSIFGHTHDISGAGNLISATCQLRIFSPHLERGGVKLDLSGLEPDKVQNMLKKFDDYLNGPNYDDSIISELCGPVMGKEAFKNFCVSKNIIDITDANTDYRALARNPQRFYKNMDGMKLLDSKENKTGLLIFCYENFVEGSINIPKYLYFISDMKKFKEYFTDEEERNRLLANQCRLFYLKSGYTTQGAKIFF